jgi:GntR family transcriptional regulator, trigonelline degradation regulator
MAQSPVLLYDDMNVYNKRRLWSRVSRSHVNWASPPAARDVEMRGKDTEMEIDLKVSKETVLDQTVSRLKSAILAGHLLPGQRLSEKKLCDLTGVSRTSIREALRVMEGERLIVSEPHKGTYVATPSRSEIDEIYELRILLEALILGDAAKNVTDAQLTALDASLAQFADAVAHNDLSGLVACANDFFEKILAASQKKVTADIVRGLHIRISLLRAISMSKSGRMLNSLQEMREIFDALRRRDSDAATKAGVRHVQAAAKALGERMSEVGEISKSWL